jgi:electron transfer flavoprotein beta subunit
MLKGNGMSSFFHIVVCAGIVPDPLQTLEPISTATGPALKNEMMLPAVLDPWGAHALYEAANLGARVPGSKVWLVSAAPKAKLQQVMMTIAQKASFELIPVDAGANGFADAHAIAKLLTEAIASVPNLDRSRLLLFGGWESASRGAGVTLQLVGEQLGIEDQFQGVDQLVLRADGAFEVLERVEGGKHLVSVCQGPPALLGWATGSLPEPKNNPQIGMANMRAMMPALQKAKAAPVPENGVHYLSVTPPKQQRRTRIVKDQAPDQVAADLFEWIKQD